MPDGRTDRLPEHYDPVVFVNVVPDTVALKERQLSSPNRCPAELLDFASGEYFVSHRWSIMDGPG